MKNVEQKTVFSMFYPRVVTLEVASVDVFMTPVPQAKTLESKRKLRE